MCLAFIIGIFISSALVINSGNALSFASKLAAFYIKDRQGVGFFPLLIRVFFRYFAVCLAFFIFGASVIGVVLSPIICCAAGLYFGSIVSFIYSVFSIKGVAFNAIVLIPASLVFSVCMFFAAKESFSFSLILLKLTFPKSRPVNVSAEFKSYCGRFLIFFVVLIIVSLIDSAVSVSFLKLFDFQLLGGAYV
ncbi:MAG: hypothetical protein IKZ47_05685 [Clostridia bacterium]|nr:hypothetical protein [Clostridia bacterium]